MEQSYHDYYRGEIYYADLNPIFGHEQGGVRPVLILQNDQGNYFSPTVLVTVATRRTFKKPTQPTHVMLANIEGLPGQSQFQLETLRTVDKRRLRQYVGKLTEAQMAEIDAALRVSLCLGEDDYTRGPCKIEDFAGRGGAAERVSFAACGEAKDVKLVTTTEVEAP